MQALVAAQSRIASGELRPVLGKNPSAEEVKEWRESHGIPEAPDKYDLGKDLKIEEVDKPWFAQVFKDLHAANATPDVVKATVKALQRIKNDALAGHDEQDKQWKQKGEDTLRTEWGGEYRRNVNLIQGLMDFAGSQELGQSFMDARLPDGRRLRDTPEAMKMLLGVALIQNPSGTVVPGGTGVTGEGIKQELDKLQKIPTAKKSNEQSTRQRELIDAAVRADLMDAQGNWKK
jgi:hypothetical protein